MWQKLLSLDDSKSSVIATFSDDIDLTERLTKNEIESAFAVLQAEQF